MPAPIAFPARFALACRPETALSGAAGAGAAS